MNILVVGEKPLKVAQDIHKIYSNAYIVEITNIKDREFLHFVKTTIDSKIITVIKTNDLYSFEINDVLSFCELYNFTLSLISSGRRSKEEEIYFALEERIPRMILWETNKLKKNYDEFINLSGSNLAYENKTI